MLIYTVSGRMLESPKQKLRSLKSDRFWERPKKFQIMQSSIFIMVWRVSRHLEINQKLTQKWPKNANLLLSKESPKAPKYLIYKHFNVFELSEKGFFFVFGSFIFGIKKTPFVDSKTPKPLYLKHLDAFRQSHRFRIRDASGSTLGPFWLSEGQGPEFRKSAQVLQIYWFGRFRALLSVPKTNVF